MLVLFEKVPKDIAIVANSILTLYALLSAILILIIFYFIFVGRAINLRRREINRRKKLIIWMMPVLFAVNMTLVYAAAYFNMIFLSAMLLVASMATFGLFYFRKFRPLLRDGDFRVQSTVAIWTVLDAITLAAMVFLFIFRNSVKLEGQFEISYDLIVQVASVLVSALGIVFTYVMRTEQSQRNDQQRLYQTLEIQSIELFRFECNHPELVRALWFSGPGDSGGYDVARYIVRQYVCQMLNLFEMAVRFRVQGILLPDAFGSWVIWIWEVCECPNFQEMWGDDAELPANYVADLRSMITAGIEISRKPGKTADEKRHAFFAEVADQLNCHEVERWFDKMPRKSRPGMAS